ncbi:MAG TPA: 16S rRNA (cytosine(1402)-N(4))-methyltransferase RsmH [Vicinamibacterales bacterium]|nr:16S rRNA (cytosine(1402)-N(4))-methyltransferase RsmH [Vicinamibacterales bacterium]
MRSPGLHRPIMVEETIGCLRPRPGDLAVDCTLGAGGHARALLERVLPGGRLIGLDIDRVELARTEAQLRGEGFGPDVFVARAANFSSLAGALAAEPRAVANVILADLGVSSMQLDTPNRGFSWKGVGPLDMRMDQGQAESAAQLIGRSSEAELAALLVENADEPHAALIARLLKEQPSDTTHAVAQRVRLGLSHACPDLPRAAVKMSTRRTFQALRVAVNREFSNLEALLEALPRCLAPGGRVAIITFHSGEDRRVKKAFRTGLRAGIYSSIATKVVRSSRDETFSNRRAAAAKLRWAERASSAGRDPA